MQSLSSSGRTGWSLRQRFELLMKNGKAPTREQKKMMKAHGLVPENWLVVKNLPDSLEVVSRVSLKKVGGKPKTRTISKSL